MSTVADQGDMGCSALQKGNAWTTQPFCYSTSTYIPKPCLQPWHRLQSCKGLGQGQHQQSLPPAPLLLGGTLFLCCCLLVRQPLPHPYFFGAPSFFAAASAFFICLLALHRAVPAAEASDSASSSSVLHVLAPTSSVRPLTYSTSSSTHRATQHTLGHRQGDTTQSLLHCMY